MIQLIGLSENVELGIREKFSIAAKHAGEKLEKILECCEEAVILSTCNRVEVYFKSRREDINLITDLYKSLDWDISKQEHTFHLKGIDAIRHLMEVTCGFNSIILGEEQILGQVKHAFELSLNKGASGKELHRLFQIAITCGKEFRYKSELYKIPVSSSSIAVNTARSRGKETFMILGFGEVGQLALKYIQSGEYQRVYLAVRNADDIKIEDERVKVIQFSERINYYKDVECIISCTSAPHTVVKREDLPDKEFLIFDLAVPRDVESSVYGMSNVDIYDIDMLEIIDIENRRKREQIMLQNRYIIEEHIKEFEEWRETLDLYPYIDMIKRFGEDIYTQRYNTFKNKKNTKDNEELAKILLKSSSNAFVNRAIEVLKEEQIKGSAEECIRIIKKMFQHPN